MKAENMKSWVVPSVVALLAVAVVRPVEAKPSLKEQLKANAEKMAMEMLPTNAVNEAAGFFGPVTKKYLPTFNAFQKEFKAAKDKLPVVEKYLPKAREAYAEAKAMKVPVKYVAKKDEYLKMFDQFLSAVSFSVAAFGSGNGTKSAQGGKP